MVITEAVTRACEHANRPISEVSHAHFMDLNDFDRQIALHVRISPGNPSAVAMQQLRDLGPQWQIGFRRDDRQSHQVGMTTFLVLTDGRVMPFPRLLGPQA